MSLFRPAPVYILFSNKILALKNLHFWDQLKASFSSNICPDCISCHLEFQNFPDPPPPMPRALGDMPQACPVSAYFQKLPIYLKTFWEHWYLQSKFYSNIKFLFKSVGNMPMYELKVQKKKSFALHTVSLYGNRRKKSCQNVSKCCKNSINLLTKFKITQVFYKHFVVFTTSYFEGINLTIVKY